MKSAEFGVSNTSRKILNLNSRSSTSSELRFERSRETKRFEEPFCKQFQSFQTAFKGLTRTSEREKVSWPAGRSELPKETANRLSDQETCCSDHHTHYRRFIAVINYKEQRTRILSKLSTFDPWTTRSPFSACVFCVCSVFLGCSNCLAAYRRILFLL